MTDHSPSHWRSLAIAADQGNLYLDADAAAACSAACDSFVAKLKSHQADVKELARVTGWGDFNSGRQLQRILSQKAVGGENNMFDVLQSHIDVVLEMKAVFDKFFVATEVLDDDTAADVQARGPR